MAMNEQHYLSGKVVKRVVPAFAGPQSNGPAMKRLLLAQGELAQFYDGENPIRYIAAIELRAGAARGNHFHRVKHESIYLLQGKALLLVEDAGTRERAEIHLEAGDLAVVSPGVVHTIKTIDAGYAIEFAPTRFDPADTYRLATA
jgi:uncharacterized RmlC-like cupin family protein